MRGKRRAVAEYRFSDDFIAVVQIEGGGEDATRQSAEVFNFCIGPAGRIDDGCIYERIPGNDSGSIYFEGATGISAGKFAEVDHSAGGGPLEGDEIVQVSWVRAGVGIADHLSQVVNTDGAADISAGQNSEVFDATGAGPIKGVLSGAGAGARIALAVGDVSTADNRAAGVEPKPAAFVGTFQQTNFRNGESLRGGAGGEQ